MIATSPKARSRSTRQTRRRAAVGQRHREVGGERDLAAAALGREDRDDPRLGRLLGSGDRPSSWRDTSSDRPHAAGSALASCASTTSRTPARSAWAIVSTSRCSRSSRTPRAGRVAAPGPRSRTRPRVGVGSEDHQRVGGQVWRGAAAAPRSGPRCARRYPGAARCAHHCRLGSKRIVIASPKIERLSTPRSNLTSEESPSRPTLSRPPSATDVASLGVALAQREGSPRAPSASAAPVRRLLRPLRLGAGTDRDHLDVGQHRPGDAVDVPGPLQPATGDLVALVRR